MHLPRHISKRRIAVCALLIYGLLLADRDAYGLFNFIAAKIPSLYAISVAFLALLYFWATLRILQNRRTINPSAYVAFLFASALIALIFFSSLAKSFDIPNAISHTIHEGVPIFVIWLALFSFKNGQRFLLTYLFIQITLSALVLVSPDFYFLDGRYYQQLQGQFVVDTSGQEGFTLDKALAGGYGIFHNPNALGFYSATAIAVGIYLIDARSWKTSTIGLWLALTGLLGWASSLTRGPMLALFAFVLIFYAARLFRMSVIWRFSWIIAGLAALTSFTIVAADFLAYLLPSLDNISIQGRLDGYNEGLSAFLAHPFLGVDNDTYWNDRAIPHLLPLYILARHGLVAGIIGFIFIYAISASTVLRAFWRSARKSGGSREQTLALALMLICTSVSLTNNLTSPFLFWISFAHAFLILHATPLVVHDDNGQIQLKEHT